MGQLIFSLYWMAAKLAGPICGFNLLTSLGLVFSALCVFWLVKSITHRFSVALLAGYAATFTPYLQYKIGGHLSYAFFGAIVLVIWQLLRFWDKPTLRKSIVLGIGTAVLFYIDPYFVLLGGTALAAGLAALVIYELAWSGNTLSERWHAVLARGKLLIAALIVMIVAVLPVIYVKYTFGEEIKSIVEGSRSEIRTEAITYGARPREYVLPTRYQPVLAKLLGERFSARDDHGSNIGETQLTISLTVWLLAIATVIAVLVASLRRSKKVFSQSTKRYVWAFAVIGAVAFLASLPPDLYGLRMPTHYIVQVIELWRVFARLQVVVNIAVVALAFIGLYHFLKIIKSRKWSYVILGLTGLLIFFEYQTFTPKAWRESWSYKEAPYVYYWLRDQKDIRAVAEYPFHEPGRTNHSVAVFTYQYIHKKPVVNSSIPHSPQSILRNALRDITDPQTIPALRNMDVGVVLIHSVDDPGQIVGLERVGTSGINIRSPTNDTVWAYRVPMGNKQTIVLAPAEGFGGLNYNSTSTEVEYEVGPSAKLRFLDTSIKSHPAEDLSITLNIRSATNESESATFSQDGKSFWSGSISNDYKTISFKASSSQPIDLKVNKSAFIKDISLSDIDVR
jgi:hypothetical protein